MDFRLSGLELMDGSRVGFSIEFDDAPGLDFVCLSNLKNQRLTKHEELAESLRESSEGGVLFSTNGFVLNN